MSSEKRKRQHVVGVRLDDEEHAAISAFAAAAKSPSVSAYLRSAGLKKRLNMSTAIPMDRDELRRLKIQHGLLADQLKTLSRAIEAGTSIDTLTEQISGTVADVAEANAALREALFPS